jgi:hypothetical protein
VDRRRIILWGILGVALLVTVTTSPLTKALFGSRTAAPIRPPAAPGAVTPPPAPRPAPTLTEEELVAWRAQHTDAWKRDPFFTLEEERALASALPPSRPAPVVAAADPALPSYTVKLVMISGTTRVAAIDGRLVSEGEMLGEERVAQIQMDGVVLERGGRRRVIEVAATAGSVGRAK